CAAHSNGSVGARDIRVLAVSCTGCRPCPYLKLNSTVLMVQSTENRHRRDMPDLLDGAVEGSVLLQR
ncbi:MAG: hypothetical protein ACM3O6_03455, partial [Acidobacteriota bacterium]